MVIMTRTEPEGGRDGEESVAGSGGGELGQEDEERSDLETNVGPMHQGSGPPSPWRLRWGRRWARAMTSVGPTSNPKMEVAADRRL